MVSEIAHPPLSTTSHISPLLPREDSSLNHHLLLLYLFLGRTSSNASTVVFEKMLRAVLDAGGSVGVLAQGVALPLVLDRVVDLHGGALLLAHTVVVEVLASLQIPNSNWRKDYADLKLAKLPTFPLSNYS